MDGWMDRWTDGLRDGLVYWMNVKITIIEEYTALPQRILRCPVHLRQEFRPIDYLLPPGPSLTPLLRWGISISAWRPGGPGPPARCRRTAACAWIRAHRSPQRRRSRSSGPPATTRPAASRQQTPGLHRAEGLTQT
eukprot:scaffold110263_cov30-Prasinocladus_malaysianus.AAC.1